MNDSSTPAADGQDIHSPAATDPLSANVSLGQSSSEMLDLLSLKGRNSEAKLSDLSSVIHGRDPDLNAIFDQGYSNTRTARETSRRLIQAYDDKGLLLSATVQPHHLSRELSCNCSELTKLVLLQWVRQGETHKLKLLGESLLTIDENRLNAETSRMMMLLAGLLGILRPSTARKLVDRASPLLRDAAEAELVYDAKLWVSAGEILSRCSSEERVFWNRRLREPTADWTWDDSESRLALSHLSVLLPKGDEASLEIFQNVVPGCWWDQWRSQLSAVAQHAHIPQLLLTQGASEGVALPPDTLSTAVSPPPSRIVFGVGMALGIAAAVVLTAMALAIFIPEFEQEIKAQQRGGISPNASIVAESQAQSNATAQETAHSATQAGAPPIRESLRLLQAVISRNGQDTSSLKPASVASVPVVSVTSMSNSAVRTLSKKDQRELARDAFEREHSDIEKLFGLLKDGSLRQHETLLQGQSGAAPSGGEEHQSLLEWLILDPPEQADTRLAATKMAMRELPLDRAVELFELCLYPGSPNEIEIRQCVELLLDISNESLSPDQASRLKSLISKKP